MIFAYDLSSKNISICQYYRRFSLDKLEQLELFLFRISLNYEYEQVMQVSFKNSVKISPSNNNAKTSSGRFKNPYI